MSKNIDVLKDKRNRLRNTIYSAAKRKDSTDKFERLISLTKEYGQMTYELTLAGCQMSIDSDRLRESYWKRLYDEYILTKQEQVNEKISKKTDRKWNITLCWSVRPDYCVCDHIVGRVRNYLITMGLRKVDECQQVFDDRTEFSETFRFEGAKVLYSMIVKSAEYVLDVSSDSIHDKCNVGIYGKKVE